MLKSWLGDNPQTSEETVFAGTAVCQNSLICVDSNTESNNNKKINKTKKKNPNCHLGLNKNKAHQPKTKACYSENTHCGVGVDRTGTCSNTLTASWTP